jgi:hypothetical protein
MPARTRRRPQAPDLTLLTPPGAVQITPDRAIPDVPVEPAPQIVREGTLRWAACPLYPGLRVGYRTNNKLQIMTTPMPGGKEIMDDPARFFRWVASYVRAFEGWRLQEADGTPIPTPTPADPESYRALLVDEELLTWVCGEGYYRALVEGQTPNSASAS